jgi:DNA-binding transcriptional MerR regulator
MSFTIRDLENFSGIKAHTIRIWEKRYSLLEPNRTSGNQRTYDLKNMLKLLNIKVLYDNGHKISKIGEYSQEEISQKVRSLVVEAESGSQAIDSFKIAMLNFDQAAFEKTYVKLISELSFRRVFLDVFIPLLEQIGFLWQVDSITPAHEHFITALIQQKILSNIERMQIIQQHEQERVFVLFLPMNEMHDLGILFLHYELTLRGYKTIYLGSSVPVENLYCLQDIFDKITFVSYFTISPSSERLPEYVQKVNENILSRKGDEFWVLGKRGADIPSEGNKAGLQVFRGLEDVLQHIE